MAFEMRENMSCELRDICSHVLRLRDAFPDAKHSHRVATEETSHLHELSYEIEELRKAIQRLDSDSRRCLDASVTDSRIVAALEQNGRHLQSVFEHSFDRLESKVQHRIKIEPSDFSLVCSAIEESRQKMLKAFESRSNVQAQAVQVDNS